jgi:hypothetical protein
MLAEQFVLVLNTGEGGLEDHVVRQGDPPPRKILLKKNVY